MFGKYYKKFGVRENFVSLKIHKKSLAQEVRQKSDISERRSKG